MTLLIGAILGFASALILQWWKYEREVWQKLVEDVCENLVAAADAASEYWLIHGKSGVTEKTETLPLLEAKLIGHQSRIDGLIVSLALRAEGSEHVFTLLQDFRDALTGGNFNVAMRPSDPARVRKAQTIAADLGVEIRRVAHRQISTGYFLATLPVRVQEFLRSLKKELGR